MTQEPLGESKSTTPRQKRWPFLRVWWSKENGVGAEASGNLAVLAVFVILLIAIFEPRLSTYF